MTPSVGRMVHYVSRGSADGAFPAVCRAAIVTEAHSDELVSLAVMNPTGLFFDGTIPYSEAPIGGTWHWPERVE